MTLRQTLAHLNPFGRLNDEIQTAKKDIVQNAQAIRSGTNIINRHMSAKDRELKIMSGALELVRGKNARDR